jgi:hypothetical protein
VREHIHMLAHLGAAHMADRERFGPPAAELELQIWYQLPAWTVEEVVALSLGYDPQSISPAIIEKLGLALHPSHAKTYQDVLRLSRTASVYMDRHRHLLRGANYMELAATLALGSYQIRPLDFLEWFERQDGRYPWHRLPEGMTKRIRTRHATAPGTSSHAAKGSPVRTGEKEATVSNADIPGACMKREVAPSAGNIENESNENPSSAAPDYLEKCLAWLKDKLNEPSPDPKFKTVEAYKDFCMKEFGISWRCFNRAWDRAKKETGSKRHGRGRPAKGK